MHKQGDPVVLPDGREGYWQQEDKDGGAWVLVWSYVPKEERKKVKRGKQ